MRDDYSRTRIAASAALVLTFGAILPAAANGQVIPRLECVDAWAVHNGQPPILLAHFSYFNPTSAPIVNFAGSSTNFFLPGSADKGQPSEFLAGVHRNVFDRIKPVERALVWILGPATAVVLDFPELRCPDARTVVIEPAKATVAAGLPMRVSLGRFRSLEFPPGPIELAYTLRDATKPTLDSGFPIAITNVNFANFAETTDLALTGLTWNDGAVTATVLAHPGLYYIQIRAMSGGQTFREMTSAVEAAPVCQTSFQPPFLPGGIQGLAYSPTVLNATSATGESATSVTLAAGSLPSGMTYAGKTLSGTPLETGAFPLSFMAHYASGCVGTIPQTLSVSGPTCASNVTSKMSLTLGGFRQNLATGKWTQTVTLRNSSTTAVTGPVALALDSLSANAVLVNATGVTACAAPLGRPYLLAGVGEVLPGQSITMGLEFTNANPSQAITYTPRVLSGGNQR